MQSALGLAKEAEARTLALGVCLETPRRCRQGAGEGVKGGTLASRSLVAPKHRSPWSPRHSAGHTSEPTSPGQVLGDASLAAISTGSGCSCVATPA